MLGFCALGTSETIDTTGRYIRHIINFWQLTIFVSLNVKVPTFLEEIYWLSKSFSTPISGMKYILDCSMNENSEDAAFSRIFFLIFVPLIFLALSGIFYLFFI